MNEQEKFEKAISLIRGGNAEEGRSILIELLKAEPKNELAWLWLARSLPNDDLRIAALEQCLKVNPESETARRNLEQLRNRRLNASLANAAPPVSAPISAPLPGRTVVDPTPPPKPVPLSERITPYDASLASTSSLAGDLQTPAPVAEPEVVVRRYTQPTAKPRRSRPRLRISLEIILVVLLVSAAGFLAWIVYRNTQSRELNLVHDGLAATAEGLQSEITFLREQVSQRQTQTAFVPSPTAELLAITTAIMPTPVASPTSSVALPDFISPINAASLVKLKQVIGSFPYDFAYSPDNVWMAGASDQGVTVWDASSLRMVRRIPLEERAEMLAFSPDSQVLAFTQSADQGKQNYLFSAFTADWSKLLGGIPFPGSTVALHFTFQNNQIILVTSEADANIYLLDSGSGDTVGVMDHPEGVLAADLNPFKNTLASGGRDDLVRIWDLVSQQLVITLSGHADDVTALAFSPDGRTLASASVDGAITLWDTDSWKVKKALEGQPGGVAKLSYSPDGYLLASSGLDNQVMLWDTTSGENKFTFTAVEGLTNLAFSPDGYNLATAGSQDIYIWGLPAP